MTNNEEDIMDEYEPAPREAYIAEALDIGTVIAKLTPLDNDDLAAFIEGYLQGKEASGEL